MKCLIADGEAQLDIGLDSACVKSGIEQPKLNRAFGEHAVQIQPMVSGIIVVRPSATSAVVPNTFKLIHRPRSLVIHLIEEACIGFFAVVFTVYLNIKCLV